MRGRNTVRLVTVDRRTLTYLSVNTVPIRLKYPPAITGSPLRHSNRLLPLNWQNDISVQSLVLSRISSHSFGIPAQRNSFDALLGKQATWPVAFSVLYREKLILQSRLKPLCSPGGQTFGVGYVCRRGGI